MSSVKTAKARERAKDRVNEVLRQEFQTELNNINSNPKLDNLDAPSADHIYHTAEEIPQMLTKNTTEAMVISDEGPRELVEEMTGSGTRHLEQRQYPVACWVVFRLELFNDYTHRGKTLNKEEVMKLRADRYAGAMVETVLKYAPDGEVIMDVDFTDDSSIANAAPSGFTEEGIIGVAGARFELTQLTDAPDHQQLP